MVEELLASPTPAARCPAESARPPQEGGDFCEKSLLHHLIDAAVDLLVEPLAVRVQPNDVLRPLVRGERLLVVEFGEPGCPVR